VHAGLNKTGPPEHNIIALCANIIIYTFIIPRAIITQIQNNSTQNRRIGICVTVCQGNGKVAIKFQYYFHVIHTTPMTMSY